MTSDEAIAVACALLERAVDEINSDIHDDPVTIETVADIRAFLANQPAAPTRTEACPIHEPGCSCVPQVIRDMKARAEAEQAVLDAVSDCDVDSLEYLRDREDGYDIEWGGELREQVRAVCAAELARRGLK